MTKNEFIEKLREALYESMDENTARIHIEYYGEYINSEIRKGKNEKEVIEELGNPRLIVKSIMDAGEDAYKYSNTVNENANTKTSNGKRKSKQSNFNSHLKDTYTFNGKQVGGFRAKITLWIILALLLLVVVAIIGSVFGIVVMIIKFLVKFIVPIAIIVAIIMIIKILGNNE